MRKILALVATALVAAPAFAADVGVSVAIGDPNFYGRIDIGGAPPPVVVYREPIVVVRSAVVVEPVYLRVRAGHAQNWSQHCAQYGACGRPVYFVQDTYYRDVYTPHYHKKHGKGHGKGDHKKNKNGKGGPDKG